jgi:RNA polymerase sigma-70 factor, ECF subfamily
MQQTPSHDLAAAVQQGNSEAAGLLYERYVLGIYRYLAYRINDPVAAEDLTSEVFFIMVRALLKNQFVMGPSASPLSFRAWLFQIARNLSIDFFRRSAAHPLSRIDEEMPSDLERPEKAMERDLTRQELSQAFEQLGDDQRDVILLRFIEGMSVAEVAAALHKSEDAVKGLQRRALMAMRETMTRTIPEESNGKSG